VLLFIVNPVSGNGRGREVWKYVKQELERKQIPYRVEFTKHSGHARELTRNSISPDLQAIVVIGGDGTIHEVGNNLIDTKVPLGLIPAGTGNDFALAHKIPFDPIIALDRVLKHQVRCMDTADLGERNMISFMGIGFDGKVAEKVNQSAWKQYLYRLTYALGAIQVLRSFQPTNLSLSVDGNLYEYDNVWLVAITNTPNYGGGMKICPDATMDDGQLDICCVRNITPSQFLRILLSVYKGNHVSHPSVNLHRGKEVSIWSDKPITSHADGEIMDRVPVHVKIRPQSLFVL
jgi:diacylglycerol kinase (ATP)